MFCWERKSDLFMAVGTEARCVQVCVEIEKWTGVHHADLLSVSYGIAYRRFHATSCNDIRPDIFRVKLRFIGGKEC